MVVKFIGNFEIKRIFKWVFKHSHLLGRISIALTELNSLLWSWVSSMKLLQHKVPISATASHYEQEKLYFDLWYLPSFALLEKLSSFKFSLPSCISQQVLQRETSSLDYHPGLNSILAKWPFFYAIPQREIKILSRHIFIIFIFPTWFLWK